MTQQQNGFVKLTAREVPLGGVRNMTVMRTLPDRRLPMVGAWCFLDEGHPARHVARVEPHPHIGLQTVTWVQEGEIWHRDSTEADAIVRPGQLNLMTAGHGVSHSEYTPGNDPELLHLIQFWIALPESARHQLPHFEQHTALPIFHKNGVKITVLLGEVDGHLSPGILYSELVGYQLDMPAGSEVTITSRADFEYAVLPISGSLDALTEKTQNGELLYVGTGHHRMTFSTESGARALVLGGIPFSEDIVMWWNFVARSHEEIEEARSDWESRSSRFGTIPGHGEERIPAPPMPGTRLKPRTRQAALK